MSDHAEAASVARTEAPRLLTGQGRFVANARDAATLSAVFVRSSLAHGVIRAIDVEEARNHQGVVTVLTAAELEGVVQPLGTDIPGDFPSLDPVLPLAAERVRAVGDPLAVVIAESTAAAEDAAELVSVDIEPLPTVVTIADALSESSEPIWPEAGTNVLWSDHRVFGADDPFPVAGKVVRARLDQHRVSNAPLETRGIVATFERGTGVLTLRTATQNPQMIRMFVARLLGMPIADVRVINGDIGGSFGQKGWLRPEDVTVAAAARLLARPVRWIEERSENLLVGGHARDERAEIEVALDGDAILGVRLAVDLDQGAHPVPMSLRNGTLNIIRTLFPSAYRIEHLDFRGRLLATNKGSYVTYRGPWAAETWFRERTFDIVAREIGADPVAFRRANLLRPHELPRKMVTGPSLHNLTLHTALDMLEAHPEYAGFRQRQIAARAEGRYLGVGIAAFIEPAPGPPDFFPSVGGFVAPPEPVELQMELDGSLTVKTIHVPTGQGHETVLAMVAADALAVPIERVRVVHGDTEAVPFELFGTGGSRFAQKAVGALKEATVLLGDRLLTIGAMLLEASPEGVVLVDGAVSVRGTPERRIAYPQLAMLAWNAPQMLPTGLERGLAVNALYANEDAGWSQGVHCCFVEVDIETGGIRVERHLAFEDCGDMLHPAIAEDQVRGGIMQGIATVLYERLAFDADGNPLSATLLDYLFPSACEAPPVFEIHHVPGGAVSRVNHRGVGEGGAIAAPPAVSNAIEDALAPFGARVTSLHVTPEDVLRMAGTL
jgi:carbon-monoxide dehydrogenase large subunit